MSFQPTYEEATCPADVLEAALSGVECGYLTVLEDRSRPSGRTLRLFASRADPPGEPAVDPGFGGIEELGINTPPGDDNSAGAQRIHRFVYKLDPRGLNLSDANLDCPEVSAAGPELVGLRLRDPEHRRVLLAAVSACRDRLLVQGIDLTAYDVAANVADLEDFRRALDIPLVNAGSNVNGSRVAETFVRMHSDVVRSFIMDSPALSTPDVLSIGPAALDLAIERLSAACAGQPACRSRVPDLSRAIREATEKLDATPLTIDVDGTLEAIRLGHPIRVVIDGAAYLRYVRHTLGSFGGALSADVVRTTEKVLAGTLGPDDTIATTLASDPGDCVGLLPRCDRVNFGALYSLVCGTLGPSIDHASIGSRHRGPRRLRRPLRPESIADCVRGLARRPGTGTSACVARQRADARNARLVRPVQHPAGRHQGCDRRAEHLHLRRPEPVVQRIRRGGLSAPHPERLDRCTQRTARRM